MAEAETEIPALDVEVNCSIRGCLAEPLPVSKRYEIRPGLFVWLPICAAHAKELDNG